MDQALLAQSAQQAAQVALVHNERLRDVARGGLLAMGELVEYPDLGEGEGALQVARVQQAEALGVEPVKVAQAKGCSERIRHAVSANS
jgi:hypothetical protein